MLALKHFHRLLLVPLVFAAIAFREINGGNVALAQASAPTQLENASTAKTLYYNNDTFYVPFTAGTSITPGLTAREVLLFVSGDNGTSWQLYQRQTPSAGRFAFRAAVDGEYWFAVRTLFGSDGEPSTQGMLPELRVFLDTEKPQLEMSAALITPAEAGVVWGISDEHLDPNSFKMEYRTSAVGIWQPILPSSAVPVEHGYSGETTWTLARAANAIEIRATVKDAAGNEAVVHDTINSVQSAAEPNLMEPSLTESNRTAIDRSIAGTVQVDSPVVRGDVFLKTQRVENPAVAHRNEEGAWQSAVATNQPSPIRVDKVPTAPIIENQTLQPLAGVLNPPVANEMLTSVAKSSSHSATNNILQSQAPVQTNLPAPTQAHMSASRQFHLDYDVEATDVENVSSVSLWVTMDNGRTWSLYGEDADRTSPFLVNVNADGIYGFRMLIENSDGIAPRPPQSGETADVWIHVDGTQPVARIASARFGRNAHLGQLQIYWDVSDANLMERPVTLLYSDQPNGPWRVIAEQLANTGRYDWTVKETVPADFYLQLEVQDTAGNIARDTLRDPISRDGLAPRGVIRDVRPADALGAPTVTDPSNTIDATLLPSQSQSPIAPPQIPSLEPAQVPARLELPQATSGAAQNADIVQAEPILERRM